MLLDLDAIFDSDRRARPYPGALPTDARCPVCGQAHAIASPADLPSEWRLEWEERAAIMEYEGGLSRELAEHSALLEIEKQLRSGHYNRQSSVVPRATETRMPG